MARDMTKGSEGKHILAFALPIMGGLVLQQLYNTVDSVVVGQKLGEAALSAVGTCSALTMFTVSFATGLCNGSGVVYAQYFGAKKLGELRKALSTGFCLLTVLGIIITVLGIALTRPLLSALAVPAEIMDMAAAYFKIYCIGLAFQFIYNVSAAALRSVGDSQATLLFLLISSILNIVLDLVFVICFKWGVAGTAIATVISQFVCALVSLIYMWKRYDFFRYQKGEFRFERFYCGQILKVGVPTMIQMCVVSSGNVLIQRVVNSLGTGAIAAATAAGRIENYMFIPCQGMNNGISTFSGQNVGAGLYDRVRSGRKQARIILLPISIALSVILWFCASPLIRLFGVNGDALQLGISHLRFIAPFFLLFALYMSNAGLLTGTGDVLATAIITLSCLLIKVVATYVFCYSFDMGFAAIYYATPTGWAWGFVVSFLRYRSGKWQNKSLVKK